MELLASERTLTDLDHVPLTNLVQRHKCGSIVSVATLPKQRVLDEADIVDWRQVPPDVVTMHSRGLVRDPQTCAEKELRLHYPANANAVADDVSVLFPVRWSVLGQRVGEPVFRPTPSAAMLSAEIAGLLLQAEASGEHAM